MPAIQFPYSMWSTQMQDNLETSVIKPKFRNLVLANETAVDLP